MVVEDKNVIDQVLPMSRPRKYLNITIFFTEKHSAHQNEWIPHFFRFLKTNFAYAKKFRVYKTKKAYISRTPHQNNMKIFVDYLHIKIYLFRIALGPREKFKKIGCL